MRVSFHSLRNNLAGYVLAAFALLIFSANISFAQEHPSEHPSEHPKEHPASKAEVSKESLAEAITGYVNKESELKGGFFVVYDDVAKEPLALTLDKVHKERLATLGKGVYFACADFAATNGKMYDLDIFMEDDHGEMEVTEINVHKVDGNARYSWVEKGGIWSKK